MKALLWGNLISIFCAMATELEILERAELYLRKLSLGINPLDDTALAENDSCKQLRISKCLTYVSDLLLERINFGKKRERKKGVFTPTSISKSDLARFVAFNEPVSISRFIGRLNGLLPSGMNRFYYQDIAQFLINEGILVSKELPDGKIVNSPTEFGSKVGFIESAINFNGEERVRVLCNRLGQQFVLENIQKCVELANERLSQKKTVDAPQKNEKVSPPPFFITKEIYDEYAREIYPLSVANFAKRINEFTKSNREIRKVLYPEIRSWFVSENLLSMQRSDEGKISYVPTEKGLECGVYHEERTGLNGNSYWTVMYNPDAQLKFLESVLKV